MAHAEDRRSALATLSATSQELFHIDFDNLRKFASVTLETLSRIDDKLNRMESTNVSTQRLAEYDASLRKDMELQMTSQTSGQKQQLDRIEQLLTRMNVRVLKLEEAEAQRGVSHERTLERLRHLEDLFSAIDVRMSTTEKLTERCAALAKTVQNLETSMDAVERDLGQVRAGTYASSVPMSPSAGSWSKATNDAFTQLVQDVRRLQQDMKGASDGVVMTRDTRKAIMALYQVLGVDPDRAMDAGDESSAMHVYWGSESAKATLQIVEQAIDRMRARLLVDCGTAEEHTKHQRAAYARIAELEEFMRTRAGVADIEQLHRDLVRLSVIGERAVDLQNLKSKVLAMAEVAGDLEHYRGELATMQEELRKKVDFRIVDMKADREYLDAKMRRLRTEMLQRIDKVGIESVGHTQQLADTLLPALDHKADRMELKKIEGIVGRMARSASEATVVQEGGAARFRCLSCSKNVGPMFHIGAEDSKKLAAEYGLPVGDNINFGTVTPQTSQSYSNARPTSPLTPATHHALNASRTEDTRLDTSSLSATPLMSMKHLKEDIHDALQAHSLNSERSTSTLLTASVHPSRPATADRKPSPTAVVRPIVNETPIANKSTSRDSPPRDRNNQNKASDKLPQMVSPGGRPSTAQARPAMALLGDDNRVYKGELPTNGRPSSAKPKKPLSPF